MNRKEIRPIAKLGDNKILVVKESDLPKIGDEKHALQVLVVLVDFQRKEVLGPELLERHLKMNPWEQITEIEQSQLRDLLFSNFTLDQIHSILDSLNEDPLSLQ